MVFLKKKIEKIGIVVYHFTRLVSRILPIHIYVCMCVSIFIYISIYLYLYIYIYLFFVSGVLVEGIWSF